MTERDVAEAVSRAIAGCLIRSGRPVPTFGEDAKVIDGVDGFDSLCGIEVTLELEGILNVSLEDNIFIKKVNGRPRARAFREVVKAISAIVTKGVS